MSNIRIYFTRALKTRTKIDIIRLDLENENFMLFKDVKETDTDGILGEDDCFDSYIERYGFDDISSLAQSGNFKEIKRIIKENDEAFEPERVYTNSKEDEDLVDLLTVFISKKEYTHKTNQKDFATDGYTELGTEWAASYASRELFDIILSGLTKEGYKEI